MPIVAQKARQLPQVRDDDIRNITQNSINHKVRENEQRAKLTPKLHCAVDAAMVTVPAAQAIRMLCMIWNTAEPHTTNMNRASSHGPT